MAAGYVDATLFSKRAIWTRSADKVRVEGVLTGSSARLEWRPNNPTAAQPITIAIPSITNQQRAKGKPFLRLVTTSQPHVFELTSEAERDAVVEVLAPLIAQTAPGAISTAAAAAVAAPTAPAAAAHQKLLESSQELRELYSQLVGAGILLAEEFWQGQQALVRRETGRASSGQRPGLSSAMLEDVQTSADGRTDTVRIRLTPELIHQTFAEKPWVRRAFVAQVPHNLTEKAFWTKYLRQQAREKARRAKAAAGDRKVEDEAAEEDADFFSRYKRSEDTATAPAAHMRHVDPTVNLVADQADSLAAGFGTGHDPRKEPASAAGGGRGSLVRELNWHAQVLMEGLSVDLPEDPAAAAAALGAARKAALAELRPAHSAAAGGTASTAEVAVWRSRGESGLDDLQSDLAEGPVQLIIRHPNNYYGGGVEAEQAAGATSVSAAAGRLVAALSAVEAHTQPRPVLPAGIAMQVLQDLTRETAMADDALGPGFAAVGGAPELLPRLQEVLRQSALTLNELLRHFWACFRFPLTSQPRLEKLERVHQGLRRQYQKIQVMEQAAGGGTERMLVQQLLRPLTDALHAAFAKYESHRAARAAATLA